MRKLLFAAALALAGLAPAQAQNMPTGPNPSIPMAVGMFCLNAGGTAWVPSGGAAANCNPSVTATVAGGFTDVTTGTPISVTTGGVTGTLPSGAVVVATNVGTTNGAYCKLGASATTSDQYLSPNGGWFAFQVGAATQLTCITGTSTTTVNMTGGSGLPTGTGGGTGGGGGGGGAVTLASGAVASGAYSSGSIASGAYAAGSIGSGAIGSGAVASGAYASGAFAVGSGTDGWNATEGTQADVAWTSGNGTIVSILKKISGNTGAATPAGTNVIGHVIADSGSTTVVTGTVTVSVPTWAGGTLGAMANYGTSPGAVLVPGVNAFVTNTVPVSVASGQIASGAIASGAIASGAVASGAIAAGAYAASSISANAAADGWDVTQGAKADVAWVSGSGSVIALLKNIAGGVASAIPAGTNVIGHIISDTGSVVAGTGTAGSAATGVVTVQGIASMTKLLVTPDSVALPANQSVNEAQINGITPLMGNGTSGTGSQRVNIASDNSPVAGLGAVAAAGAPPANVIWNGVNASGATGGHIAGLIGCDSHVFKHITSATDTLAVQGVASQTVYVCGWRSRAAGVATWFLENTASANANCSSANTQITGVATEAANTGETMLAPYWTGLKNTSGNGLCINSTGTGGVDVDIWYTQF